MSISAPMVNPKARVDEGDVELTDTRFIAPHAAFTSLYKKKPKSFARRFLGCEDVADARNVLRAFWAQARPPCFINTFERQMNCPSDVF